MARYINLDKIEPFRSSFYLAYFRKVLLEVCPVEDVKPVVHAHWVYIGDKDPLYTHKCSNCGSKRKWTIVTDKYVNGQYCGCCGATMDEEVNNG